MSFSFSTSLTTALDRVRFALGDIVELGHRIEDETITAVLVRQPIETYAAAACAQAIAGTLAAKVDKSIGATSITLSQQMAHYMELAKTLREGGPGALPGGDGSGSSAPEVWAGGVSYTERDTLNADSDYIKPSFSVGMDDAGRVGDTPGLTAEEWDASIRR